MKSSNNHFLLNSNYFFCNKTESKKYFISSRTKNDSLTNNNILFCSSSLMAYISAAVNHFMPDDIEVYSNIFFTIGIGILYIPNFTLGLATGAVLYFCMLMIILGCKTFFPVNSSSTYEKMIMSQKFHTSIIAPVLEEMLFRGILQPLLINLSILFAPTTSTAITIFGFSLSAPVIFAIGITSIIFGAAHMKNKHEMVNLQVLFASLFGNVLGFLAFEFGLGASVGAHIMNNFLAITVDLIFFSGVIAKPEINTSPSFINYN